MCQLAKNQTRSSIVGLPFDKGPYELGQTQPTSCSVSSNFIVEKFLAIIVTHGGQSSG